MGRSIGVGFGTAGGNEALREAFRHAGQLAAPQQRENPLEHLLRIQQQTYERAAGHAKLVLGLGYAGFFAVWSALREQLTAFETVASGLLMGFSLFVYVFFEVYQMLHQARLLNGFQRALMSDTSALPKALEVYSKQERTSTAILLRVWYGALVLTILPAIAAAAMLLNAFVFKVVSILF